MSKIALLKTKAFQFAFIITLVAGIGFAFALDTDNDGDGILDGAEVNDLSTNLLAAEFDGTLEIVATLSGSQTNHVAGDWEIEGSQVRSKSRRGFVEYVINFPERELYDFNMNAAHFWSKNSCTPVAPVDTSHLQIHIDGNGVKDWIETAIVAMARVDTAVESIVSPACIEGDARSVPFMSITGGAEASLPAVKQSAGPRWYANLLLEQDGTTTATATFQNGALEVPINVEWVPLNLIDHDGETLLIRKGDRLKLEALPANAHGGQFTLNVFGEDHRSPNTNPLIFDFDEAGTYTLNGDYRKGNQHTYATIEVQVIAGTFPAESPACLVGRTREWTFTGMDTNMVLEVDDTVEVSRLDTTNLTLNTVALRATKTNGEHVMLARLYENGPILDSTRLDTFWVQNAVDGYFITVETYEDSELWEVESITKNLPGSVDLEIKVFIAGVTLDDYTLERWITNAAYDEIGTYYFQLFHPNEVSSSVCHSFRAYQDGQFIGTDFGGGKNNIEEE